MNKMKKRICIFTMLLIALIALPISGAMADEYTNTNMPTTITSGSHTLDLGGATVTITSPIWIQGGSLTVKNGTITSNCDAFIVGKRYSNNGTEATAEATLTIESSASINVSGSGNNCVYINGTPHQATLTTAGNLYSAEGPAIQGNGSANSGKVNVTGGSVTSGNDVAIFHPQKDKLTISGGVVSGVVGVEIRNGELSVSGNAEIKTTGTGAATATANGNGSTAQNAAIAVSPHSNTGSDTVKVTISGNPKILANGSAAAIYGVKTVTKNGKAGASESSKIDITVTGGTIQGEVKSENQQTTGQNEKINIEILKQNIPVSVNLPQTGDNSNLALFASLLALSGAGMLLLKKRGMSR